VTSVGQKRLKGLRYHPRSPHASRVRLQQLAGVFSLSGPMPSPKFLEELPATEKVKEQPPSTRAGD